MPIRLQWFFRNSLLLLLFISSQAMASDDCSSSSSSSASQVASADLAPLYQNDTKNNSSAGLSDNGLIRFENSSQSANIEFTATSSAPGRPSGTITNPDGSTRSVQREAGGVTTITDKDTSGKTTRNAQEVNSGPGRQDYASTTDPETGKTITVTNPSRGSNSPSGTITNPDGSSRTVQSERGGVTTTTDRDASGNITRNAQEMGSTNATPSAAPASVKPPATNSNDSNPDDSAGRPTAEEPKDMPSSTQQVSTVPDTKPLSQRVERDNSSDFDQAGRPTSSTPRDTNPSTYHVISTEQNR